MQKPQFRTHQEIDNHYRALGVDVDKLNREVEECGILIDKAIENVRKRKTFFQRLFWKPYGSVFKPLGYLDQEVEKEIIKLKKDKER